MSLDDYIGKLKAEIPPSPHIRSVWVEVKAFSSSYGRVKITLQFDDGSELHIAQVVNLDKSDPVSKYGYHYQDKAGETIFRYDDKPHFPGLSTFPHHKHKPGEVLPASRPSIRDVILEALNFVLGGKR